MTFSFIVSDLYFRNISFESFEVIFPFNYNFAECFEEVRIIFFFLLNLIQFDCILYKCNIKEMFLIQTF